MTLGALGLGLVAAVVIAVLTTPENKTADEPQAAAITGEPTMAPQPDQPAETPEPSDAAEVSADDDAQTETVEPAMTPVEDTEQTMQPVAVEDEPTEPTTDEPEAIEIDLAAIEADEPADAEVEIVETASDEPADVDADVVAVDADAPQAEPAIETTETPEATEVATDSTPKADAGNRQPATAVVAASVADASAAAPSVAELAVADTTQGDVASDEAPSSGTASVPVTPATQAAPADDGEEIAARDPEWVDQWAVLADEFEARKQAVATTESDTEQPASTPAPRRQPPVLSNIEGTGGGVITPSAYLLNPGPKNKVFGMPTMSNRFLRFGSKDLSTLAVGETLWGRIELSYAVQHFGLGGFPDAVQKRLGRDIVRDNAWMHVWSIRGKLIEEDSFGLPLPAVTAGVSFKYNDSIQTIDERMGHALRAAGLDKSNGVDYTLTTTKTICDPWLGRPLSLTAGMRFSNGAQMGLMGFENSCHFSVEGGVRYFPTDWLAVGYEFREKPDVYDDIPGVYGHEESAHAITADIRVTDNLTISTGWVMMGHVANGSADCGWTLGMQWDF
jgi:hypothetical protein